MGSAAPGKCPPLRGHGKCQSLSVLFLCYRKVFEQAEEERMSKATEIEQEMLNRKKGADDALRVQRLRAVAQMEECAQFELQKQVSGFVKRLTPNIKWLSLSYRSERESCTNKGWKSI
jgi:hypothetical protein